MKNSIKTVCCVHILAAISAITLLFSSAAFAAKASPHSSPEGSTLTAEHVFAWQAVKVAPGGTLSGVFAKAGLGANSWHRVLGLGGPTKALTRLRPGDVVRLKQTSAGKLGQLRYHIGQFKTLVVNRRGGKLHVHIHKTPTHTQPRTVAGKVEGSLSGSLAKAGVPATIANKLEQVYKPRINLSRQIQRGDQFRIIYNERYQGQKPVGTGSLVAARLTVGKHKVSVFRFVGPQSHTLYLNAKGKSFKPGISRHPVNYTRISSPFQKERMDPAIHKVQPHNGTDMAAPLGTPVRAAANGTVKYIGWAHGYGRVIYLRNFDGYTTRYAHLHHFAPGLSKGDHVKRGQKIGTVGNTGWSTGPHLLFEIRKNGVPHNPMTMPLPATNPLSSKQLSKFKKHIRPLETILDQPIHPDAYADVLGLFDGCPTNGMHSTTSTQNNEAKNALSCIPPTLNKAG